MSSRLAIIVLALTLGGFATDSAAVSPSLQQREPAWNQAVANIEAAKESGLLTVEDAAVYRFWAITDLDLLPAEFLPESRPKDQSPNLTRDDGPPVDGLSVLAAKLDALFVDEHVWSPQTRSVVMGLFEEASKSASAALADLPETELTPHFAIHWTDQGADAPPAGAAYIDAIANSLEEAWTKLEGPDYGYEMPDPSEFGLVPDPNDGITRFDVFVVEEVKACGVLPLDHAIGSTLPGEIRLVNDRPLARIPTDTAHELFHMLQWNYAGFKGMCPLGMLSAGVWYLTEGVWLMESTSTWIEDEIYPATLLQHFSHKSSRGTTPTLSGGARA